MNRITSILAGTVTAALSGAVVAAAAVGQGVFDGQPTKPAPKGVETQQAQTWAGNATAAATAQSTPELVAQQPQPRIVYVDKEPIIMTRTIQQPAPNDSAQSAAPETPTAAPTTNATPSTPDAKTPEKTKTPEAPPVAAAEPRVFAPQNPSTPPPAPTSARSSDDGNRPAVGASAPAAPTAAAPTQPPAAAPTSTHHDDDDHHSSGGTREVEHDD